MHTRSSVTTLTSPPLSHIRHQATNSYYSKAAQEYLKVTCALKVQVAQKVFHITFTSRNTLTFSSGSCISSTHLHVIIVSLKIKKYIPLKHTCLSHTSAHYGTH